MRSLFKPFPNNKSKEYSDKNTNRADDTGDNNNDDGEEDDADHGQLLDDMDCQVSPGGDETSTE